jgi:hypothetical protein
LPHRAIDTALPSDVYFLMRASASSRFLPELVARGVRPDLVTDQTSAHDPLHGYLPKGWTWENIRRVAAQGNRHRFAFGRVFFDARQRVIKILGLLCLPPVWAGWVARSRWPPRWLARAR